MKLEQDEFVVSYDASEVSDKELLAACEKSGFPATIATGTEYSDLPLGEKTNADFSPPDFYTEALETAKRDGKPIVLDFMATWCAPCKRIANETFVDENVAKLLGKCVLLKIDTDENPEIAKHFGVSGLPDIRFLDPDGIEVEKLRGFQPAETFALELQQLLDPSKKR